MDRPSQRFDRTLFTLKLSELSHEMQARSVTSDRKARADANGSGSFLLNMADGQLAVLRDWLEGVDRICREVWEIQGERVTPEFVQDVLLPEAMMLIEVRKGVAMSNIGLVAARTQDTGRQVAQRHLTMEINRLKSKVCTKYDVEARTLEHKKVRHVGQAPAPTTPLRGGAIAHSTPKLTEIPGSPPVYFPGDLWPKTNLILLEAQRKFPIRTQTLEMCRHIIVQMTPVLCEAVRAGKMTANAALTEGLGGMADLLHSILVWNDDSPKSGFSALSEQAYRLGQEARRSDEWLILARAIDELPVQNDEKIAQPEESRPTGRPRKDAEREMVRELKEKGESWKEIAVKVNTQTSQNKSPEAYRALLRSSSPNRRPPGKNGQK
jgi:hypothetical protein